MRMGGSQLLAWAWLTVTVTAAAKLNDAVFKRWLADEKGFSFGTVSIIEDANGFRRMIATEAIKENFLLVKIPFESAFSEQTVFNGANLTLTGYNCDDDLAQKLDARSRLVLTLMQEQRDPDSAWRPFLDTMPHGQDRDQLPLSWKREDLDLFRGSGMMMEVTKDQGMHLEQYAVLAEACPEFAEKVSSTEFLNMAALVTASGSGEETILPYVVFANHDSNPNAEIGAAADEGVFALVSAKDIKAGEEISISYTGEAASFLPTLPRYGFTSETDRGILLFPACIPPSLADMLEEKQAEAESQLEGFSPELKSCCQDRNNGDDKSCFASQIRDPKAINTMGANSFPFAIGPILPDGREQNQGDLAEIFHRIRTMVFDSGLTHKCPRQNVDMEMPISMASELYVMRLFKILIAAHLGESSWAHVAGGTPPPPANKATEARVELVRKGLIVERGVFNWYVAAANFVDDYLQSPTTEALQQKLCADFFWHRARPKAKPQGYSKYVWMVENILAPLAFQQKLEEDGEPCGIKKAHYQLKPKECKAIMKKAKDEEL